MEHRLGLDENALKWFRESDLSNKGQEQVWGDVGALGVGTFKELVRLRFDEPKALALDWGVSVQQPGQFPIPTYRWGLIIGVGRASRGGLSVPGLIGGGSSDQGLLDDLPRLVTAQSLIVSAFRTDSNAYPSPPLVSCWAVKSETPRPYLTEIASRTYSYALAADLVLSGIDMPPPDATHIMIGRSNASGYFTSYMALTCTIGGVDIIMGTSQFGSGIPWPIPRQATAWKITRNAGGFLETVLVQWLR